MEIRGTTILVVRKGKTVCMGGDGQVTMGQSIVMKHSARKVRRLHDGNLSGQFILIPFCIFIISVLLIILLRVIPGDITPYLPYLTLCSNLMDQLSILFLAMMLIKGTPGPNRYGILPQKITVS